MRTLPIVRCRGGGCRQYIEWGPDDAKVDVVRVLIICHRCGTQNNVNRAVYIELFGDPELPADERPPKKEEVPDAVRREEAPKEEATPEPKPEPEAPPPEAPEPKEEVAPPADDRFEKGREALLAVEKYGTYAKAAKALGVTAPTIGNRIAKLTKEEKKHINVVGVVPATAKAVE